MNIKLFITIFLSFFSTNLLAQSMETNVQGIVIKDFYCSSTGDYVGGNLINRNSIAFRGKIRTKIIDSDGDIAWQGTKYIEVGAQNGVSFGVSIGVKGCKAPNKVQITLEP